MRDLGAELASPDAGSSHMVKALVQAVCLGLARRYSGRGSAVETSPSPATHAGAKLSDRELVKVLTFLDNNLEGHATNEDLAFASGYSCDHFRRLFRNTVGLAAHQYVLRTRVDAAVAALVERPDQTVAAIAGQYGFSDQGHLCRAMRRLRGVTPSMVRRGKLDR